MTKAIAQTYNITMEYRARLTGTILMISALMAAIYGWNLYRVVSSTITLHQAEINAARLSGNLDGLDAQYIRLSDKITPDSLKAYGMSQAKVSEYISRNASLGRVAMSGHEL